MPSTCWSPPVESREVITSSKTSRTSCAAVASRSASRNARSPGMTPPEPWSGSTTTAASSCACSAIRRVAPSASLYCATTNGNGALIGEPAAVWKKKTPPW